ncbi:hypothetical protein F5I97DRAFT_1115314 [Phlebopus sp. FC_14]|nr:hypothetical protein F5I97DRAFT_1115314 [Phlebopus sp. FC_14]
MERKMTGILIEIHSQLDQYLRSLAASSFFHPVDQPDNLETPYSRYVTLNFIARPEDREPIDAILAERQSQIMDLTQEIERVDDLCQTLQVIRAKLRERQSRVEESRQFHRGFTSAVRRLPPEILADIFCHCMPERPCTPCGTAIPLVLTQVCQRWRSIATATPQLWSSLTIPLRRAVRDEYRLQYDAWMARAKSVPLVLAVENVHHIDSPKFTPCLLDWLRCLPSRCRDFSWYGYSVEGLLTSSCVMQLLERLEAHYFKNRDSPSIGIDIYSNASKLKSVSLHVPYPSNFHNLVTLPWAQLTSIDIYGPWCTDILRLFEVCIRMEHAEFTLPYEDDLQAVIPGSVINHSLKFLVINVWASRLCGLLFDALVLPSLEELEVGFADGHEIWPHPQLTSLLTRSGCPLKRLEVCGKNSVSDYLSEYRALLPSCTFKIL